MGLVGISHHPSNRKLLKVSKVLPFVEKIKEIDMIISHQTTS